ncbi:MAG TPA: ABC transporter permease [Actinomycetes bacterium]|nr:ABC transporter permease [Actinomycetes bacterium]
MIFEAIRLGVDRLRANAARSALTVIGVIIGVGSVVTLVAVGRGSAADVNDQFSGLGANTLTVTSARGFARGFGRGVAGAAGSANSLKLSDLGALQKLSTVAAVAPVVQAQETITGGATSVQSPVKGTTTTLMRTDHLRDRAALPGLRSRGGGDRSCRRLGPPLIHTIRLVGYTLRLPANQTE